MNVKSRKNENPRANRQSAHEEKPDDIKVRIPSWTVLDFTSTMWMKIRVTRKKWEKFSNSNRNSCEFFLDRTCGTLCSECVYLLVTSPQIRALELYTLMYAHAKSYTNYQPGWCRSEGVCHWSRDACILHVRWRTVHVRFHWGLGALNSASKGDLCIIV